MARARQRASELAKLLSSSQQPIYALDEDQTLVFCNDACLDWLGYQPDEILGRRSAYHSTPEVTGNEAAVAALCPPPEAIAGREMWSTVCCPDRSGRLRCRRAHFIPLAGVPEETIGVVVQLDVEDLPATEPVAREQGQSEAEWLHLRIQRFRHEAAAALRLDRLLGDSPAMRRARAQVAVAAPCSASVLVVGPPGSGRQRIAGTIHYGGPDQSEGNLIPLACSVLGADLIGSAVRAVAERRLDSGTPSRGTLLLNDVDLLPAEVQAEMAGVLGSRSFPLRIIGTVREPLEELVNRGQYHDDLAAILSTIIIRLPPLARRREDLPVLAQAFIEEINSRSPKQVAGFKPEALDYLDGYDWPGNVDELAQTVAKAHEHAEGPLVGVRDLPQQIHLARDAAAHPRRTEERIVLDDFLARIERELIERAMARAKGNKTKAAELLGMTRPRLYRRLIQLGLEEDRSQVGGGTAEGGGRRGEDGE